MKIRNLACHSAGYVVNGPEMFAWALLGSYYIQEGKVSPATREEIVLGILEYPHNTYSQTELEEALENLCGAGRNGPIQLTPLLKKTDDGSLLPTEDFGIML